MLKDLISKFGKEKINILTKYSSILTLHQLGEKGCLKNQLTTPIENELMYATEKIDGTNARIVCFGNEYLIGTRENILHHSDDLYFDNAQGIVEGLKALNIQIPKTELLTSSMESFTAAKPLPIQNGMVRIKTDFVSLILLFMMTCQHLSCRHKKFPDAVR